MKGHALGNNGTVVNRIPSFSLPVCWVFVDATSSHRRVFFFPSLSFPSTRSALSWRIPANTRRKSRYKICKINSANYARALSVVEINSRKSRGDSNQIAECRPSPVHVSLSLSLSLSLARGLSLVIRIVNRRCCERLTNDRWMYREISH